MFYSVCIISLFDRIKLTLILKIAVISSVFLNNIVLTLISSSDIKPKTQLKSFTTFTSLTEDNVHG
jgi:hypothetical protein